MSEQPKTPPWFKAPLAEAEARLRRVALRVNEPLSRVTWIWLKVQAAAQALDRCGAFDLDRAELALLDHVAEDAIERIFLAFEAADILLIAEGRCTTFKEKEKSRDQKMRERTAAERTAAERASDAAALRDARHAVCTPTATREATSASRIAVESSESSSLRTTRELEDPPQSVVVESRPCVREDGTTMTDEEIFQSISKIDPSKITKKVASAGVAEARKWIAEGLDLERDILPELSRIAKRLAGPLGSLGREFVVNEIRARHQQRLAADAVPRAPPIGAEFGLDAGRHRAPDYEMEFLRKMEAAGNA